MRSAAVTETQVYLSRAAWHGHDHVTAADTRDLAIQTPRRRLPVVVGLLLLLSAGYLSWLLFGYLFGVVTVRRHQLESASYIFAAAALVTALTRSAPAAPALGGYAPAPPWIPLALIGAATALYANTLFLGLFSDDFALVQKALDHEWMAQTEFVRPFPLAAWALLLSISRNPAVLHALSIGLHGLNAALVYTLALRLGLRTGAAAAAGALFAVFPASVEAVVWPAAIHDLIVGACTLGFVVLAGRRRSWRSSAAAIVLLVVALLSKESALAIPLLAAVIWLRPGSARANPAACGARAAAFAARLGASRGLEHGLLAAPLVLTAIAVCALYTVIRLAVVVVPGSFAQPPTRYMLKELIARPVGTLSIPWDTQVVEWWPVVPFLWAACTITAAATYAWSTTRHVPVHVVIRCISAALVAVLPVYSMLFFTADLGNARYLYVSTAFWAIALMAMASPLGDLSAGRVVILSGALAMGAVGVQVHRGSWREAADLRERVLAAAADTLKSAPCAPVSFAGAPDSVRGAYVFRNGLPEAILFRTGARPASPSGSCTFVWRGSEFQRSTMEGGQVPAGIAR
jgi:hypothetical protein